MSNEFRATPGPWIVATSCSYRRILSRRGEPVAVPVVQQSDGHPDIYFPNGGAEGPDASLIAAAPNLYAALEDCIASLVDAGRDHAPSVASGREALKMARGNHD